MNFTLHFLLLLGKFKKVFRNEELRWYTGLTIGISLFIAIFTSVDYEV
jgi:Trk-type K+ transport system membrane component